jgi:transcriptional regulator with XRE-family HTH domain
MFGKRLKQLRKENRWTQKELGEKINISDRVIGYYESSERFPSDETILNKIAEIFNVSVDYLLGRTDIKSPYINNEKIKNKAYHHLDKYGLPEEAIQQIEEYIEFIKQKYNPDGTLKKK